jgi:hypothetical protein
MSVQMTRILAAVEQELGTGHWEPQVRAVLNAIRIPTPETVELLRQSYGQVVAAEQIAARDEWVSERLGLFASLIETVLA